MISNIENKATLNDLLSYASFWLHKMSMGVNERKVHLASLLHNDDYSKNVIKLAGRYAGRRPGWHLEKGLLERFRHAGYGKYVVEFGRLESKDFDEQLLKGENLMTAIPQVILDKKRLLNATVRVLVSCKFPTEKFTPVSVEFAAENQVNKSSSSGFPYFRRKGHVLDKLITETKAILDNTLNVYFDYPCVRGFRLQIRETAGELYRKVRLMYPYPGSLILLEDTFIMPFVEHFIKADTFYVIGRNGAQIGQRLKDVLGNSKSICSLDINAYDQNLITEAIISAFWIIRQQLVLTKLESIAFENMVTYFCTSIMVSKQPEMGVYAFIRDHGIPSGSGFTNMIGTIAHAIVLEYCSPGLISGGKSLICGDDNIFDSTGIDLKKLYSDYKISFNLTVDMTKTDNYNSSLKVKFLGFTYLNYERYVSPKLVINQCLWHTDFFTTLSTYDRELARSASVLLNGKNGAAIFARVFPDVMKNLREGENIRFIYLYGYSPPSALEGMGEIRLKSSALNNSLLEHLRKGYLIR